MTLTATIRNSRTAGIPAAEVTVKNTDENPDQGLPWQGYEKMITVIFLSGCFYINDVRAVDDGL